MNYMKIIMRKWINYMKDDKFENLKTKISMLEWDDSNLIKHTIKHPIGDWINEKESKKSNKYKLQWSRILGFYDIPSSKNDPKFEMTKEMYRKLSLNNLRNINNSIIYYHNGRNLKGQIYRSVGIFEDKIYKDDDMILTTHIRGEFHKNEENYYITTAYLKERGFKEKFYYAYMLLRKPEIFKISIDKNIFFDKNGIPKEFKLDKLEQLYDESRLSDDKVAEIFNRVLYNKKTNFNNYTYLQYAYNNNVYSININEIYNKIKINNRVKKIVNNKLIKYKNELGFNDLSKKIKNDNGVWCDLNKNKAFIEGKISFDDDLQELYSKLVSFDVLKTFFDNLYKCNRYNEKEINDFLDRCFLTSKFLHLIHDYDYYSKTNSLNNGLDIKNIIEGFPDKLNVFPLLYIRKYIELKNEKLNEERNNILCEMSMDDENMFYMSLYKNLAKYNKDYCDEYFDIQSKYDKDIEKIIKNNLID